MWGLSVVRERLSQMGVSVRMWEEEEVEEGLQFITRMHWDLNSLRTVLLEGQEAAYFLVVVRGRFICKDQEEKLES